jgi:transcriptional regulator with XRE-family HTH domain
MSVSSQNLGARLRRLRQDWGLTQTRVAEALGVSTALVSSWETGAAVPGEERLNEYARFFATRRSVAADPAVLLALADLTAAENQERATHVDELVRLRDEALGLTPGVRGGGALGGRFWHFPDGQPVTILCSPLSRADLGWSADGPMAPAVRYATNPSHPNAVQHLRNGDIDALLELVGHVRAENPTSEVRWLMYDQVTSPEELTGHLVVLGGGVSDITDLPDGADPSMVLDFVTGMGLPVSARVSEGGDPEFDLEFTVSVDEEKVPVAGAGDLEVYPPTFRHDEAAEGSPRVLSRGAPLLDADVALVARRPHPVNHTAQVTLLRGIFSRGTHGAVKAFTDPRFRARNEQWLYDRMDPGDFWMLVRVPVLGAVGTVAPDLDTPSTRLRTSPVA